MGFICLEIKGNDCNIQDFRIWRGASSGGDRCDGREGTRRNGRLAGTQSGQGSLWNKAEAQGSTELEAKAI